MAIQNRRGIHTDFDATKMVAGEFAIVQSGDPNNTNGTSVYICFQNGSAKRLTLVEDLDAVVGSLSNLETTDKTSIVDAINELAEKSSILFGTSSTTGATRDKVVTCADFEAVDGALIAITVSQDNTVTNARFNVNSTGAKSIYTNNDPTGDTSWLTKGTYLFVYNSTNGGRFTLIGATERIASDTAPAMDGTAAVGTSKKYARADHVHPSDTTKATVAALNETNAEVSQLKEDLSEKTYNLIDSVLKARSVSASGGIVSYGDTTDLYTAPVTQGKTYTIKTDDSSAFVGAFYESCPTDSTASSYNNSRVVGGSKTFTAPITGWVAFRATSSYTTAQIVEGDSDKPYIKPITATDYVARYTIDELTTYTDRYTQVTGVVTDGKIRGVSSTQDVTGWEYETFQCEAGERYRVTCYAGQYFAPWIAFDASDHYVSFSQMPSSIPVGKQVETFTVPANATYFCVNNKKELGSIKVERIINDELVLSNDKIVYDGKTLNDVFPFLINSNILYNKILCCCGDSITYGADMDAEGITDNSPITVYQSDNSGNFAEKTSSFLKTWNWQIASRNGMTLYNAGVSGSTMQGLADKNGFSLANGRYTKLPDNIDYLLIWFGWNDTAYGTLGTINDATNESYYGGYNVVLPYLINKYPDTKIGLIVPFGCDAEHREAVRLLGNKWGVAVWDNYQGGTPLYYGKESSVGVEASIVTANQTKFQANGAHPNYKGHMELSHMIEHWMRGL